MSVSAYCEVTAKAAAGAPLSVFERYLTLWVALCIVAGIALGQGLPRATLIKPTKLAGFESLPQ